MSDLVRLRPMNPSEVDLIVGWERDPENAPYIIPWSEAQHEAGRADPDLRHLIVDDHGAPVGFVLLAGLTNEERSIELRRIVIVAKGLGYGRTAVEEVKRLSFEQLNARRLWLDVVETNRRARRLYESTGFRIEEIQKDALTIRGKVASLVVMSMSASDYSTALSRTRGA